MQMYVARRHVDMLRARMLLTVDCVATTVCVGMWTMVTVVLTSVCGAGVRAEGRCGCDESADMLTSECVVSTGCVVMGIVVTFVLTAVWDAAVCAEGRCGCAGSADVLTAECVWRRQCALGCG